MTNATADAYANLFQPQYLDPAEGGGSSMPPSVTAPQPGEIGAPIGQLDAPSPLPDYGQVYSPNEEQAEIRLNLSAPDMARYLDAEQGRVNAARRSLDLAFGEAVNMGYRLDEPGEWTRLRSERPETYERIDAAIQRAGKVSRTVAANADAAERETSAAPMALSESDASRAATLLPLLSVEVERLPLTDLRDRLRHAIATENAAAQYVLATLLPARLGRGAGQTAEGTVRRSDGDRRVISELDGMLADVKSRLRDRSLGELHGRAQAVRSGALALKHEAGRRRRANTTTAADRAYEQATGRKIERVNWNTGRGNA